jgi:Arc/MetJ-type ribon-helix-helix transcriptional regulator
LIVSVHVDFKLEGRLGEHVAAVTEGGGWYASVEEYMRDLIRKDVETEHAKFEAFKAELREAFAVPASECVEVTAADVIARGRARRQA